MLMTRNKFFSLVLLLAVSGVSWAQINFGSWGRVVITPLAFSGDYSAASAATSTWGDAPYISFSANGKAPSGNIGFNIDFDFGYDLEKNGYNIVGDNAKVWVYPLGLLVPDQYSMLKLVAGRFMEDELRGKIGATEFGSWVLPNGSKDEDNIFTRLKATAGAYARLEPLKWLDSPWNGLTLHAVFGSNSLGAFGNRLRAILNLYNNEANDTGKATPGGWIYEESGVYKENGGENRDTTAKDVFKAGQYALGYRIPSVGLARFQYLGNNRNVWRLDSLPNGAIVSTQHDIERKLVTGIDRGNADVIEFAFLYDGLDGLKVDVGAKLPLEYTTNGIFEVIPPIFFGRTESALTSVKDDEYSVQLPKVISLGVNWTPSFLSRLNIVSRFDYSFGGKMEQTKKDRDYSLNETGSSFNVWLVPSYKIIPILTLGLDLGMEIKQTDNLIKNGKPYSDYEGFIVKDSNGKETNPTEWNDFGVAPWVELQVGGGKVRTGVVIMLPGSPRYKADTNVGRVNYKFKGDPVISVPISITYSF
jgi:hypothetical protein